jgi:subtilisin-like proprotein convertase family protein
MKKTLLILFFSVFTAYGQNSMWKITSESKLASTPKMERGVIPSKFHLFDLDLQKLKTKLQQAPLDTDRSVSSLIIEFPNPAGELTTYRVYEAPVMEKGLMDKFPSIKSYSAQGIEDPTAVLRFSVTEFGLHLVASTSAFGTFYIDTYTKNLNSYIVYNRKNISQARSFGCHVENSIQEDLDKQIFENRVLVNDGNLRQYRLAVTCTIEYSAYHLTQAGTPPAASLATKKAVVLSAMVVSMTRLNAIYEREVAVRMNLIANNDLIIFIDSDSYTNSPTMINEIQPIVDGLIGFGNYDMGHGFCTTDSGVAQLQSVCSSGKARGITGQLNPVGDPFDVDYVAHEMGHQFGGNHTQNNNCNRSSIASYEPGSASTIMGYAGICAPNVQNNSNDYFHARSVEEITTFITTSATCRTLTPIANIAPVVNAGSNYTIPNGTAFKLTGSATDANGDALTYCWEQYNNQVSTQPPLSTATTGPNFRSVSPTTSPDRYMPRIQDVINNNMAPTWEVVPTVARTMNFALTVRDNRAGGGMSNRGDITVATASVGPFLVNSPNTAVSWVAGTNQTVTWAVAGTIANGINASYVDVLLSTDGGFTYPILLASKVPNDGSEIITIPNNVGTQNRIMVRGYNHIFYDISNANFTISAPTSTFGVAFNGTVGEQNKDACQGTNVSYSFPYSTYGGFSASTAFTVTGQPVGSTVVFTPANTAADGTINMQVSNTSGSAPGLYNMIVTGTSGGTTKTVPFYLNLISGNFGTQNLTSPANAATAQSTSLTLTWATNVAATSYDLEVATDAGFSSITTSVNVATASYNLSGLSDGATYYWRVKPKNAGCVGTFSTTFNFQTGQTLCNSTSSTNIPVAISSGGTPTINSTLNIPSGSSISDINITMNITHTWINDLTATLISPTGTQLVLFDMPCISADIQNIVATFDDAGSSIVCGVNPGISGVVIPQNALSVFNSQSPVGTWTLRIRDNFNQDGGSLNSWSLNICSVQPLAAESFNSIADLAIYPNPNNGNFNVQFNSTSNNDVKIGVHDMRGREIFNRAYQNNGLFNESLQLNNVQSGIYLVTVQDGARKEVKKIVVE